MINLTPALRPFFVHRASAQARWADPIGIERIQRGVLQRLVRHGAATAYGRRHGMAGVDCYEAYSATIPMVEYEDIRAEVMQMMQGQPDVLWPGRCRRFAQSSGTSGGKSKYIPITDTALRVNHYAGASMSVAFYLNLYKHSRLFGGKCFILGGSFANELPDIPAGVCVGDLSATLIDNINPAVNMLRVPTKDVALMADWTEKLPRLTEASLHADITNISGVPSWFMTVLRAVMERAGVDNIHRVWPHLEVFFHGGISFAPYRREYDSFCTPGRMRYHENYNASEGFFACQDTEAGGSMRLLPDVGVFYEFLPLDGGAPVPAWQVEPGRVYSLIISCCNGLWRYAIGDTVRIDSIEPLRISIAGRTSAYINAFGEELMVWNADTAIERTCRTTGASISNYTAAPVYSHDGKRGYHQWFVEWTTAPAVGTDAFAASLDAELRRLNSDYDAKRSNDIFLAPLRVIAVEQGTFDRLLADTGPLGGQRKVPRLCNDRHIADKLLEISKQL